MQSRQVLFKGADLLVTAQIDLNPGSIVISFTNLNSSKTTGFAETFLTSHNISNVCFIAMRDHWWQSAEMPRALSIVRSLAKAFPNRITYGTSMGAYGALNFAEELEATRVLAFAPQASPDQTVTPFEKRWVERRSKIVPIHDNLWKRRCRTAETTIVYDPYDADGRHVEIINNPNIRHVRIPYTGHHIITFIGQTRLLKGAVLATFQGNDPWFTLIPALLRARRNFPQYWFNMASNAAKRGRTKLAATLLQRAAELPMKDYAQAQRLAKEFEALGLWDEALAALDVAQAFPQCKEWPILQHRSRILEKSRSPVENYEALKVLCAHSQRSDVELKRFAQAALRVGKLEEARNAAREIISDQDFVDHVVKKAETV